MPFNRVSFCSGCTFLHIPTGNVLLVDRQTDGSFIELKLSMDNREVAYFVLVDKFDNNVLDKIISLNNQQCHYVIELFSIEMEAGLEITCLDSLMLFIALQEVKINGGYTLYLMSVPDECLWRYIKYGFYPAPERVNSQYQQARRRGRWFFQRDRIVPFHERYAMSKNHFLYKSSVEISLDYLKQDISENYKSRGYRPKRARGLR